jgi:hypothetical protein
MKPYVLTLLISTIVVVSNLVGTIERKRAWVTLLSAAGGRIDRARAQRRLP